MRKSTNTMKYAAMNCDHCDKHLQIGERVHIICPEYTAHMRRSTNYCYSFRGSVCKRHVLVGRGTRIYPSQSLIYVTMMKNRPVRDNMGEQVFCGSCGPYHSLLEFVESGFGGLHNDMFLRKIGMMFPEEGVVNLYRDDVHDHPAGWDD